MFLPFQPFLAFLAFLAFLTFLPYRSHQIPTASVPIVIGMPTFA